MTEKLYKVEWSREKCYEQIEGGNRLIAAIKASPEHSAADKLDAIQRVQSFIDKIQTALDNDD